MTTLSDVAQALGTILSALPDVDASSIDDYMPSINTQKIALMIVPFDQSGTMAFAGTGRHSVNHAHRLVCEFWIKVNTGNHAAAMVRGRDICLEALRLIAANPTLNGTVNQVGSSLLGDTNTIGQYDILPRVEERGQMPFVIARLFVPIDMREVGQW